MKIKNERVKQMATMGKRRSVAASNGIIEEQRARLAVLEKKSTDALSIVTTTIRNLGDVNAEIDGVMTAIDGYKAELDATQNQLGDTKEKNLKILNKFRSLIED